MRLIILAAGRGTRLSPHTDGRPKCMVELAGRPLIEWHLRAARAADITDIAVVTGYCGEQIAFPGISVVKNPEFATTNMVYSLWCARHLFEDDFVLGYGDILYNPPVLKALSLSVDPITVVIDRQWRSYWTQRSDDVLADAESLRLDLQGRITDIGQKVEHIEEIQGQYIGLMRFQGLGVRALEDLLQQQFEAHLAGGQGPHPKRNFAQLYMTDVLQELIGRGQPLHSLPIDGEWLEIDNSADLRLAGAIVRPSAEHLVISR